MQLIFLLVWSEARRAGGSGSVLSSSNRRHRFHYSLHPSAAQAAIRSLERQLSSGNVSISNYPSHWFLPEQNSVYAAIPDPLDPEHRGNRQLHQFHALRHLSRYEIKFRREKGIDLNIGWNGTYDHDLLQGCNASGEYDNSSWSCYFSRRQLFSGGGMSEDTIMKGTSVPYGGIFDNYQAVPLSQGYGTHYANVWVGSPTPQRKTVIVDTGSHYTAFPCTGCVNCGLPHHTDPFYNPTKSKTFRLLQCDECRDGVICESGQCRFQQSYTEGSSWEAVQVQDKFYCGGTDILDSVNPDDEKYAIEFMFGCQTAMTGLFITQLADGIMGMSAHSATLPKHLYDKRLIEHNMFAMCYRRELGTSKRGVTAGSLTIGGYSSNLDTSPMIYAKNMASVGWFTVYVKNIYIRSGGGQSAFSNDPNHKTIRVHIDPASLNSGKGVIVDSGTTDTYLNVRVSREFSRAWKAATGSQYSHSPIRLSKEELLKLPTILIQCHAYSQRDDPSIDDYDSIPGFTGKLDPKNKNDLLIAIPATSYMDYSPVTKLYTSRVYFTETAGGVLGSNTMVGHNVAFDWSNGRIGFAESACAYDKTERPPPVLDEGYASDCLVGDPILSQTCLETVDGRMCANNPTNIALLGTEIWTAVVESPGSETGTTCIDAVKGNFMGSVLDDAVINCEGDGLCEEIRPCQLTCHQREKATKIKPVDKDDSGCGDSFWSACDYGCRQGRIKSIPYSDGFCREMARESRPCHIEACARSDPCRVPFLIHSVLGFKGASWGKWSLETEDSFTTALTQACQRLSKTTFFEEGDINILAVLPWNRYEDVSAKDWAMNEDAGKKQELVEDDFGMKVVLEISIFNPQAKLVNISLFRDDVSEGGSILRNFRVNKGKATCDEDDLYVLAKKALQLRKEVLSRNLFMPILIEELKRTEGLMDPDSRMEQLSTTYDSPFERVYSSDEYIIYSKVLAVWSIRTEIDDEINYFGPPKPTWFRLLTLVHTLIFALMSFMLLTTAWSIILACMDTFSDNATMPRTRRASFWKRQRLVIGRDTELEDTIMGAPEVELSVQSPRYRRDNSGTSPIKRRSTLNSQSVNSLPIHEKERLL